MNAFVWNYLIFVAIYHASIASADIHNLLRQLDVEENNPYVSESEKNTIDEYRKTLIQEEILKRLGLDSPPNDTHVPHFPKQMVENLLRQTTPDEERAAADSQAGAHEQIIAMAEPDSSLKDFEISRPQYLRFQTNLKLGLISSATLVLRRNPKALTEKVLRKHNFLIVRIIGLTHRLTRTIGHPKLVESNRNWMKLDITSLLKTNDADTMMTNVSIKITCKECEDGKGFLNSKNRRPFLIFKLKSAAKTRSKRSSTTCSGSATKKCCLVKYQASFSRDLGYNFIVAPARFQLNYCKGNCQGNSYGLFFHKRIKILNVNRTNTCCVVSKLKPLTILYFKNSKLVQKDLPNITATECQCS